MCPAKFGRKGGRGVATSAAAASAPQKFKVDHVRWTKIDRLKWKSDSNLSDVIFKKRQSLNITELIYCQKALLSH